jgi:alcohol dehydrogenase
VTTEAGFECGVLNGKVQPGNAVAIVGAGPIGLAALLTAQFYSPAEIIMIDLNENRLQVAAQLHSGILATHAGEVVGAGSEGRPRRGCDAPHHTSAKFRIGIHVGAGAGPGLSAI